MQNQESNDHMAYWLSNTSTLLFLIQKSLKPGGSVGATPTRKPQPPTSLFGRMTMVLKFLIFCSLFKLICSPFKSSSYSSLTLMAALSDYAVLFSGLSFVAFCCQPCCSCSCIGRASSWSKIPCSAFQAAAYSICWKDIWNY